MHYWQQYGVHECVMVCKRNDEERGNSSLSYVRSCLLSVVFSCCPYLKLKRLIKQWVLVLSSGASPLFSAVCWHPVQFQNHVWINNLPLGARPDGFWQAVGADDLHQ